MREKTENNKYDDIIHLPHHTSAVRLRMSMADRAAQFYLDENGDIGWNIIPLL